MAMLATLRSSRRAVAHLASSASLSVRPASSLAAVEADSRPGGGGFFANLFAGGGGPGGVPMTEPLPGAPVVVPAAAPAAPPATQSSSLPNGATIAAEDTPGPTTTLGIYVDSGSVYETPEFTGASHLLEYLAFKATTHRTHFRLTREVEAMGGHVLAAASREQMAYAVDVPRPLAAEALEVLADAVLNPRFEAHEVAEAAARLEADRAAAGEASPQAVLLEGLHEVAFTGGLARPLIAPPGASPKLTPDALRAFVAANYTAPRMVLAGAGIGHAELSGLGSPLLAAALPAGAPRPASPASAYVGGDFRQYSAAGLTHTMLAFEAPGGWRAVEAAVALTVAQFLLGGGGSFSAGGPGKGMHSRLYTRVLNRHAWVHNCTAFSSLYNDTGLVGVFATAESAKAADVVSVVAAELAALASAPVPAADLERAKAAAISSVLMNLESRAVVAEDIGRQVLTYGHRKPVAEFVGAIRALSPGGLQAAVKACLATPLTMATLGDIAAVPRYDAVAAKFK